jgi:hypothetical protein
MTTMSARNASCHSVKHRQDGVVHSIAENDRTLSGQHPKTMKIPNRGPLWNSKSGMPVIAFDRKPKCPSENILNQWNHL